MKPGEILASFIVIAITIIVVSLIGIYALSNQGCGCVSKTYDIAVTADRTGADSISITYHGGPDADELRINDSFEVYVNNKTATNMDAVKHSGLAATLDPATGLENNIGSTVTITGSDITYIEISKKTHVVVTASFKDGTQEVILDTYE